MSLFIPRDPADVFAYFVDLRHEPEYNRQVSDIRKTTEGAIRLGTTFEGKHVGMGKVTWRLSEFVAPRHVVVEGDAGDAPYRFTAEFEPIVGGTRMTGVMEWTGRGLFGALDPLVAIALRVNARRSFRKMRDVLAKRAALAGDGAR